MTSANPLKHHYVPRFLIARFADEKGKVTAYNRRTQKTHTRQNPRNVLVEKNFYRALTKRKGEEYTLERLFAYGEDRWTSLIKLITKNGIVDHEQIPDIAEFLAVQFIRTPQRRHTFRVSSDYLRTGMAIIDLRARQEAGELSAEDQAISERFIADANAGKVRVFEPDSNLLAMQFSSLLELAERLAIGWHYVIVSIDHRGFILTDDPIARLGDWDGSISSDVGILNAKEIWMPLDPSHALVLTRDFTVPRHVIGLHRDHVRKINQRLVLESARWTIYHPGPDPLEKIDIPTEPPKLFIDEFTVPGFGRERGDSFLHFGRVKPHVENEHLLSRRRLVPFPVREHNYLEDGQVWIPDNDPPFKDLPIVDAKLL